MEFHKNVTLITPDSQMIRKAPDMSMQIFNPLNVDIVSKKEKI